ncbi:hypothetical protein CBM2609_A80097 [Cupriavidus taiwanensis]|nr:hypothetical protein CBM2604_A60624 [Cupriavidus taiwanensis]SOZ29331.1 hypothetical protein CBM2609_A80097 [Cupriavidus taiwanensis]SOZ46799.1 hypothetical protein CBM2610_A80586 [Cupriavidus taiwanensis]
MRAQGRHAAAAHAVDAPRGVALPAPCATVLPGHVRAMSGPARVAHLRLYVHAGSH